MKNLWCALTLFSAAVMSMAACAANKVPPAYRVAADSTDHACTLGAAACAQVYLTNAGLFDQTRCDADKTCVVSDQFGELPSQTLSADTPDEK